MKYQKQMAKVQNPIPVILIVPMILTKPTQMIYLLHLYQENRKFKILSEQQIILKQKLTRVQLSIKILTQKSSIQGNISMDHLPVIPLLHRHCQQKVPTQTKPSPSKIATNILGQFLSVSLSLQPPEKKINFMEWQSIWEETKQRGKHITYFFFSIFCHCREKVFEVSFHFNYYFSGKWMEANFLSHWKYLPIMSIKTDTTPSTEIFQTKILWLRVEPEIKMAIDEERQQGLLHLLYQLLHRLVQP